MRRLRLLVVLAVIVWFETGPARALARAKVPVLLDTDIGTALDDAFALALVLSSPELELRGVTTVDGDAYTRALVACRILAAIGRDDVPVASGCGPRSIPDSRDQLPYGLCTSFRKRPLPQPAIAFLYDQLRSDPGNLTLLAIGPLTNVAELVRTHPDCKPWIKRIVLMGGAICVGYNGKPPVEAEWNIRMDIQAAQTVFASGIPLLIAPLDATTELKLEEPLRRRLLSARTPLTQQLCALYQLTDRSTPTLFDPVAVALCFDGQFCKLQELRLEVDDHGFTRVVQGRANARVATTILSQEFLKWYLDRLAPLPVAPSSHSKARPGQAGPRQE
jgi:inosine-uridine nucleoside N-ribohydrolase